MFGTILAASAKFAAVCSVVAVGEQLFRAGDSGARGEIDCILLFLIKFALQMFALSNCSLNMFNVRFSFLIAGFLTYNLGFKNGSISFLSSQ